MTIIEQIKAEVDKRYAEYREKMKSDDFTYYEGMADALDLFEQFIDTLESEKPMQEGLEEEIERYLHSLGVGYGGWVDGMDDDDLRGIARHFAKWGAKHLADARKTSPKDLEERWAELQTNFREINEAFEAGKKEQKEQMMNEAVEGVLVATGIGHLRIEAETDGKNGMKHGDKVRIIIVKEN